jgi:hypothetical protein
MRKLLKLWYVWLGLVLLLGLAGSVALICSGRGRITQANFDLIQEGMTEEQVIAILGSAEIYTAGPEVHFLRMPEVHNYRRVLWKNGPNRIVVIFDGGRVWIKEADLATAWETLQWYAKKGAEKIGVKWN